MSYEYLCSLYYGEGSNADLTDRAARDRVHVATPLDDFVVAALRSNRDVVLTGNPGDGKSHLARRLLDRGDLGEALFISDLSERDTRDTEREWRAARSEGRRVLLCGNEGPLRELIGTLDANDEIGRELRAQIGRLVCDDPAKLPSEPRSVVLVDLADRNTLSRQVIREVLRKVSSNDYMPAVPGAAETAAGRNLLMLQSDEVRENLARILSLAGGMTGEHVTFRELWAAIAYSISAAKAPSTLKVEQSGIEDGSWDAPLDNLMSSRGRGRLIEAVRRYADPAATPWPELDEDLWSNGRPRGGEMLIDEDLNGEPPEQLWRRGKRVEAIARQRWLKRLVAVAHSLGARLIERMEAAAPLPSALDDAGLQSMVCLGLRRLYLVSREEAAAPPWLSAGVPLWVSISYEENDPADRPHVAVTALPEKDFALRRPRRPPWLGDALGPLPEVAWLHHEESNASLRVEPSLLGALRSAASSTGPSPLPERVHRFLDRVAGWSESQRPSEDGERFAIVDRPRGRVLAAGVVSAVQEGGASYG
ncbi:MAG: hypothetical protein JNK05_37085 [Myxococcales bacterium]|nr:hypothetical protein [Myxococcales bacterium]